MKQIIFLLLSLFLFNVYVNAQSKPKRDKSKDSSVLVAKQQAAAKAKAAQEAELKRKQASKRRKKPAPPKLASYLTVDGSAFLSLRLLESSGSQDMLVSTDGQEWSIRFLPNWCKVTKYQDHFTLVYDSNPAYDERSGYFEVVSDNKEVRVNLTQPAAPINITANINNAYLEHNVTITDKTQYLKIDADVSVCGAGGLPCSVVAFITDEYGNNIKAAFSYPAYAMKLTNDLYSAAEIKPLSNYTENYHVTIYIPNNSMQLVNKNNKLRCKLYFYCNKNSKYIDGVNYVLDFNAKNKKGKVTTKKK